MNNVRFGNFTSSQIWKLTKKDKSGKGFGAPALTYIEERNMERLLGRRIDTEMNAKATTWGNHLESIAFDLIPSISYSLTSKDTLQHQTIPFWKGSPDGKFQDFVNGIEVDGVFDIKAPYTLKSFCLLVTPMYTHNDGNIAIEEIKQTEDGYKYYWQIVSNAILTGVNIGELIVYMPYEDNLSEIRDEADGDPDKYWIWSSSDEELPSIKRGGYFNDLNIIRFDIPQEDKDALTELVERAGEKLIKIPSVITAHHDSNVGATIIQ